MPGPTVAVARTPRHRKVHCQVEIEVKVKEEPSISLVDRCLVAHVPNISPTCHIISPMSLYLSATHIKCFYVIDAFLNILWSTLTTYVESNQIITFTPHLQDNLRNIPEMLAGMSGTCRRHVMSCHLFCGSDVRFPGTRATKAKDR